MYIIIAGCSKVGASLVNRLSEEGNDVVVIDRDEENFSQLGSGSNCMQESTLLNDEQKRKLYADIYEDSTWLIGLVENLLSITRIDNQTLALTLKPELISDVIDEAVAHAKHRAQHHNLSVSISDELLMVRVDASLIVQVLVNLIDNAVKYTPEGSDITISAIQKGKQVLVSVADNGPGISDDVKPKLFEMFFTAGTIRSDARRGLGLGLALCRAIVAAHGGEIWVSDHDKYLCRLLNSIILQKQQRF